VAALFVFTTIGIYFSSMIGIVTRLPAVI